MVFGTLAQSLEAARRLHHRHASITGTLRSAAGPFPAGSFYCANEASALRWVHATLAETAVMAYALVLPALTPEQRERYYAESRLFGALFGIPREHLALLVGNGAGYSQLDKLRGTFGKDIPTGSCSTTCCPLPRRNMAASTPKRCARPRSTSISRPAAPFRATG